LTFGFCDFWSSHAKQQAWIIPGITPNNVSPILISKSHPHPREMTTDNGGKITAHNTEQKPILAEIRPT